MKKLIIAGFIACILCSCGENIPEQIEEKVKYMGAASAELGTVEYTISKIIKADHDVFYNFTAQERNELLKQAEEVIIADAGNLGILKDAEENTRMLFEALLAGSGYKKVNVLFANN